MSAMTNNTIKTRVKPDSISPNPRARYYQLEHLENYPPELPKLIEEAAGRLKVCPFCGGDDVRLLYNFVRDYGHYGEPHHLFRVECHTACCHIQTIDYPEHTDDVDSIRNALNYVVQCWNRRPAAFYAQSRMTAETIESLDDLITHLRESFICSDSCLSKICEQCEQLKQKEFTLSAQMEKILDGLNDENLRKQAEEMEKVEKLLGAIPDFTRCSDLESLLRDIHIKKTQSFLLALAKYKDAPEKQ